jgi:probable rRNA maturation factor
LSISFHFADKQYPIKFRSKRKQWLTSCAKKEGRIIGSVKIIFCSDNFLIKINRKFLQHNYYTDVITFSESKDQYIDGEIYISVERVRENCQIYSTTFEDELNRVLIHGLLHLINYTDLTVNEKFKMTTRENYYLKKY